MRSRCFRVSRVDDRGCVSRGRTFRERPSRDPRRPRTSDRDDKKSVYHSPSTTRPRADPRGGLRNNCRLGARLSRGMGTVTPSASPRLSIAKVYVRSGRARRSGDYDQAVERETSRDPTHLARALAMRKTPAPLLKRHTLDTAESMEKLIRDVRARDERARRKRATPIRSDSDGLDGMISLARRGRRVAGRTRNAELPIIRSGGLRHGTQKPTEGGAILRVDKPPPDVVRRRRRHRRAPRQEGRPAGTLERSPPVCSSSVRPAPDCR